MATFKVWAPLPKKVELQLADQRLAMTRDDSGWWTAEVPGVQVGDLYGFHLDDTGPFPDPRAGSQPNGVYDLSRWLGTSLFPWTDQAFKALPLAGAIVYELHIGTFTPAGTFLSTIDKLPELVALGVTHIELMPVVEFSGQRGWGYDGVDLYAPHHAYGTPEELKKLVNAAHNVGLAVILDVVYNHLGPSGNYLAKFGPYFTKKFATFWGEGINFDGPDSDEVRRFFCDNALLWLRDFHFDALRLDAVHGIIDTSAVHILEQLSREVRDLARQIGRPLALIPESDLNDPRLIQSPDRGGYGLDAQWSDDFHHTLHTILTGETTGYYSDFGKIADLAKALRRVFVYDGNYSAHRRRCHGRPVENLSGGHFLGYLQNHDQIGNRAQGDRISQSISPGKLKIGAALVLTSPFVPMLFQGEEWAASTPFFYFTDYQEPELAQAVRAGRCREFAAFGWKPEDTADPQDPETFRRSKLIWEERTAPGHADILNWYQSLIQLRRHEPDLSNGNLDAVQVEFAEAARWLVLRRGAIAVVCNFHSQPQSIKVGPGKVETLLASQPANLSGESVELAAESVAILRLTSASAPA